MAEINLTNITIPTPQPYDDKDEHRQRENLAYVALQMLQEAQTQGMTLKDGLVSAIEALDGGGGVPIDLSGVEQALKDLRFNSITFDLGAFKAVLDGRTLTILDL